MPLSDFLPAFLTDSTRRSPVVPLPSAPPDGLPLQGLTLLTVEDSRYAADALRLYGLRSGARMRRAGDLAEARRHLSLYRPDLVLVDMGLPDGCGAELISQILADPRAPVVLAISGDPVWRSAALAAGAHDFLEKPLPGLRAFQQLMLRHLPDRGGGCGLNAGAAGVTEPDRLALREDLLRAAQLLARAGADRDRLYLAGFLAGIARTTADPDLADAALALPGGGGAALADLQQLVCNRLADLPAAFAVLPVQ